MRVAFHDLLVGQGFIGPGRTLSETDHGLFMMLVGEWHLIHADADFARSTPFKHSFGVAIAMGTLAGVLEHEELILGPLGLKNWQFHKPLFIGDTVHLEMEITGTRRTSAGDKGIVDRHLSAIKYDGTVAQSGHAAVMLRLASTG